MNPYLLIILASSLLIAKGDIVIDKNINVKQTKIKWNREKTGSVNCGDVIKGDTITVFLGTSGFGGYTFNMQLVGNKKNLSVYRWSDYPQFDGKSSIKVACSKFKLRINKDSFKEGDTLRAKFSVRTIEDKYSEKLNIEGEIFHIIGGNLYRWNDETSHKDMFFKNGYPVYKTINDSL